MVKFQSSINIQQIFTLLSIYKQELYDALKELRKNLTHSV